MEEGEQSSSIKKSPSNPNMDLLDTNQMPNLKSSKEEIAKTVDRKNRASRPFATNSNVAKRSPTRMKDTLTDEVVSETQPVVRKEPLKDHSSEMEDKKRPIEHPSPDKKSLKDMAAGFFHLPFKTRKSAKEDDSPPEEMQGKIEFKYKNT